MAMTCEVKSLVLRAGANLGRLSQTFDMEFQVRSDTAATIVEVSSFLWTTGLPYNLSGYGAPYAVLDTWEAQPDDPNTPIIFKGKAAYKQSDFLGQTTFVDFGNSPYDEVIWKARNSEDKEVAVLNSAGYRYLDPLLDDTRHQVIRISKCYSLGISPTWFAKYVNSVNLNAITIADFAIPERGAWMREGTPKIQVFSPVEYSWRFDMEIVIRGGGKTWDRELLDQGMFYLEPVVGWTPTPLELDVGGRIKTFYDPNYVKKNNQWFYRRRATVKDKDTGEVKNSEEPVLLDGEGQLLQDTTPGNEKYIAFQVKDKIEWADLALPRTMAEVLFVG